MTLPILALMIFVITLGLSTTGLYFFVEVPASRKRLRTRLANVQQALSPRGEEPETSLLREQLLSGVPAIHRFLQRVPGMDRLQFLLQQAAVELTVGMLLLLCVTLALVGLVAGWMLSMALPMIVLMAAGTGAVPFAVVFVKRSRRFDSFSEIFPDAIDLLGRAVRAGHAFTTGFELIAKEMPEPLAGEFRIAYDHQNLGMPLREALENLAQRMPTPDVRFFVSALQLQRETGGNLAEILEKLSYVIRERFKLHRQVKVYTAEGRMSLYVLTAVPPVTAVLLYFANRDYIMTLFRDPLGHKIVAMAIVFQVVGYLMIRKITQLKV
jgi:tight adherence protein B